MVARLDLTARCHDLMTRLVFVQMVFNIDLTATLTRLDSDYNATRRDDLMSRLVTRLDSDCDDDKRRVLCACVSNVARVSVCANITYARVFA